MRRAAVKSAARTLQVLELFAERRTPLRLHDIHVALNYPQSSTTNLLKSMVMMGYLNYSRVTRAYLPTNRVAMLGNWLPSFLYGQRRYQDLLEELLQKTDETVVLCTQNDLYVQYVRVSTPTHRFKVPPPEGTMRLLTNSGAGLALLSQMNDRQIDKICRYTNYYELDQERRIDPVQVMQEVNRVRQTGYCFAPNRPVAGLAAIAIPLGEELHGIPLSIGIGGLVERLSARKEELVSALQESIATFKFHLEQQTPVELPAGGEASGPLHD
jgi:IclR family KDG regulon transcriptional repressor